MEQYVEQTFDDDYTEEDIRNVIGNAVSGFGKITGQQNAMSYGNMIAQRGMQRQNGFNNPQMPRPGGIPGSGMNNGMSGGYGAYTRGTRYNTPRPYNGNPDRRP